MTQRNTLTRIVVITLMALSPLLWDIAFAADSLNATGFSPKVEIVRETHVGSGTFGAVSKLPIFASEVGQGSTMSTKCNWERITVGFSANLTTTNIASAMMEYSGTAGFYNGELIETGPGSRIFQDAENGVVVALTNPSQAVSGTVGSSLSLKVSVQNIKLRNKTVTLTNTAPFIFQAGAPFTDVILSGPLSPTKSNTIVACFNDQFGSQTLTETEVNRRVFQDANRATSLTISRFIQGKSGMGSQMQIMVSSRLTLPSEFGATLQETGPGTNQFSNYQYTVGPGIYATPATDGQGVFYIQLSGTVSTEVVLRSGSNKITVAATPVAGKPNLLRTGKLVLIEPNDPFRDPDITTLTVDPKSTDSALTFQTKSKANSGSE